MVPAAAAGQDQASGTASAGVNVLVEVVTKAEPGPTTSDTGTVDQGTEPSATPDAGQDPGQEAPGQEASQWVDIEEAVLFEMFPDDTDAVEDALRRFAGLAHQAARALEALLARPTSPAAPMPAQMPAAAETLPSAAAQPATAQPERSAGSRQIRPTAPTTPSQLPAAAEAAPSAAAQPPGGQAASAAATAPPQPGTAAQTSSGSKQPTLGQRESQGSRLGLSSKGRQDIAELMQSKDKLRQVAERPFRRAQPRPLTHLDFPSFQHALVEVCMDFKMSVPAEKQIAQLYEKHRRDSAGVGKEEFESMLFRMLSFLLASGEVSNVAPVSQAQGEERDKRWREEFLKRNPRRFSDVYELGRKLGEGSFGAAYMATHRTELSGPSRRVRVCKIIEKKMADEVGTSHQRVREEFAVLKRLDHPHVVRIFEDFEDDRSFYLLMEQCKGGDLQDAVKSPATRDAAQWEHWAAKVIHQTLSALAYCHGKGIIHKDLKPENVMMSTKEFQDVHVIIVDFGLAEMFSSTQRAKEIAGTPPFMAPEVWTGRFGNKCDIWGIGCILFYILSGTLPFMARKVEEFPKVVAKEPNWQVIGGASAEAQHICWRMLCKAEAVRPSAQEVLDDQWFWVHGLGNNWAPPRIDQKHYRGLMQVKGRSNFEKFVSRLVATQLDAGQQKRVNEAFLAFDKDKDGTLSRDELRRGLLMLGARPEEAEQVANELDVSKTGRISYTEFLAGVMDLRSRSPKERDRFLWLAWQQFSPDERGLVKTSAVQDALAARGMTVAELPSAFLRQLRRGSAGELSFQDFKSLFEADESLCVMSSFMGSMRSGDEV